jgi:small subunit ribosomal protein S27Ae
MAKVVKKGKRKRSNKKPSERWKKYTVSGDRTIRSGKFCPRCGQGIFLAESKNRLFCGKCHYVEFKK